jgi:hypothetical protein
MAIRKQARLLATLSMVLGVHLIIVWLLVASPRLPIKTKYGSLQLVWLKRVTPEIAPQRETKTHSSTNTSLRHHPNGSSAFSTAARPGVEEDNAIYSAPDWSEELQLAAKDSLAKELAQKQHESDFSHTFPRKPKKAQEFAWNYAATHRVEAIPQGGILIHLGDHCVLVLIPLPIVGCGIGKIPVNGDLFEHTQDK